MNFSNTSSLNATGEIFALCDYDYLFLQNLSYS